MFPICALAHGLCLSLSVSPDSHLTLLACQRCQQAQRDNTCSVKILSCWSSIFAIRNKQSVQSTCSVCMLMWNSTRKLLAKEAASIKTFDEIITMIFFPCPLFSWPRQSHQVCVWIHSQREQVPKRMTRFCKQLMFANPPLAKLADFDSLLLHYHFHSQAMGCNEIKIF